MGCLRDITLSNNTHLLFTNSGKAEMYVYDTLKEVCGATRESIYEVQSKREFNSMLELVGMQPFLAIKWVFIINFSKLKGLCKSNRGLFQVSTACFLVKVSSYRDYKEFKEIVPNCNDLYLSYIRSKDVRYVMRGFNLSQKVLTFIETSYASDVEKVFELKEKLENGEEVEKPKDVVRLIGTSGGTVQKLALQLLNNLPKTERSLQRVCKNRLQVLNDLCETYGIKSVRNFLLGSVKDILDIKVLYMQGIIFQRIRDIPEKYDEKRLSKYQYCIKTITDDIPYTRVLRLYNLLKTSGMWYNSQDMLLFLYTYYAGMEV